MTDTTKFNLKPGQELRVRVAEDGSLVGEFFAPSASEPDGSLVHFGTVSSPAGRPLEVRKFEAVAR